MVTDPSTASRGPDPDRGQLMRAVVLRGYGPPERLQLTEVPRPVPREGEVLVRVRACSVQPYDWHLMRGEPVVARIMPGGPGLRGPRVRILGADVAGQVEAVGPGVTGLRPGEAVYAMLPGGGFAQYACAPADLFAPMPGNLSFEQAAAVPLAGMTALIALRDRGRLQPGQRVLVNGASGGVGTFAVQLARAYGAEVTGVCGTRNVELVRSLGANEVVDYTRADFTSDRGRYDLLIDIAGSRAGRVARRVLKRGGTYVAVGGPGGRWVQPAGHVFAVLAMGLFVRQRMVMADVVGDEHKRRNLGTLTRFIEDGQVTPVIDRRYSFEDIPAAVRYSEEGHAAGKVVVAV